MRGWIAGALGRDGDDRARSAAIERRMRELEASAGMLSQVLDSLGEGVVAVDSAGIVVHVNPAATDLLSIDAAWAVGQHMYVAVPDPQVSAVLESVLRGEGGASQSLVREVELHRGLVPVIATVRATPMRAGDGETRGAIALVRDITDVRRAEAARADFFTNVSHELKTPVTAIQGIVETLLSDDAMDPATRERFLDKASRQSRRLGTLVTDVIALSRIESDPGAMSRGIVDLGRVVRECIAACAVAADGAGINVSIGDMPAAPALVVGDEEALLQALSNLVINGITHSDRGAKVTVHIRPEGHRYEIEVADTGPGIAPEHVARIFERFYRADPARSRERGGSGLGLSIVKHVALAHDGEVMVSSVPGEGTSFHLRLPAADERAGSGS